MGAGAAVSGGLGLVGGISNMISGAKQANEAERALENYERQKLTNIADGLQVSTLGSDLQREEQARLASGQIGALREGGTRSLIGGLGKVEAGNQRVMQQTAADLDMQQRQIDQMQAEDQARIRSMQENREIGDISALSSQVNTGNQMQANGFSQIAQGTSMLGGAFGAGKQAEGATQGGFTTSGNPTGGTNSFYQSPANYQNIDAYGLNSQGQPNSYINPFSIPNPYQVTRR
jgi:hypothetical protein